jgi:hypothetical protein
MRPGTRILRSSWCDRMAVSQPVEPLVKGAPAFGRRGIPAGGVDHARLAALRARRHVDHGLLAARSALGWCWRAALIALSLIVTTGCDGNPVGPSLADVEVRDVRVEPTEGNATLCCCRVAASAVNGNTVSVHVTVKFFVYDDDPSYPVAALVHFINNMDPGSEQPIVAQGMVFACSRVKDVQVEVDVTRPTTTGL